MGYDMRWEHDPDGSQAYFQLNIGGMRIVVNLMDRVGAIHHRMPYQRFPQHDDFGLRSYPDEYEPESLTDDDRKYLAAVEETLSASIEYPGIPIHKVFGTNDGWLVTQFECMSAVKAWDERKSEIADCEHFDLADAFMAYVRTAIDHGGFRVR